VAALERGGGFGALVEQLSCVALVLTPGRFSVLAISIRVGTKGGV